MPYCLVCRAETVTTQYCNRHRPNTIEVHCRFCNAPMQGPSAICSACGAMGNPKGTPPPVHLRALCEQVIKARRETKGKILLVCNPIIPRPYFLRLFREGGANEVEVNGITMAVPQSLPKGMSFDETFLDPDVNDPAVAEYLAMVKVVPSGRSTVYDWLRKPGL